MLMVMPDAVTQNVPSIWDLKLLTAPQGKRRVLLGECVCVCVRVCVCVCVHRIVSGFICFLLVFWVHMQTKITHPHSTLGDSVYPGLCYGGLPPNKPVHNGGLSLWTWLSAPRPRSYPRTNPVTPERLSGGSSIHLTCPPYQIQVYRPEIIVDSLFP